MPRVSLPEDIGMSEKLEKLRITSNQIKRLPYSILKLWKNSEPPGQLEESLDASRSQRQSHRQGSWWIGTPWRCPALQPLRWRVSGRPQV